MPQSLSAVYIHLVFSTKNRQPFLRNLDIRTRLHAQLGGISKTLGCAPILTGGIEDHVHILARLKQYGVTTFQAEDEIAACCSALGASYAGKLGITASSGPGVALDIRPPDLRAAAVLRAGAVRVEVENDGHSVGVGLGGVHGLPPWAGADRRGRDNLRAGGQGRAGAGARLRDHRGRAGGPRGSAPG